MLATVGGVTSTVHSEDLVLTNVNVVPVTQQKLLRNQTAYIKDGRI